MIPEPRDAATVLLLRPCATNPFEVFMVRRHSASGFMGGMYVYPGGKCDPADSAAEIEPFCFGVTAADAAVVLGAGLEPRRALGHFVAAVRETFEEAGVLLAVDSQGHPVDVATAGPGLAWARAALQGGHTSLVAILAALGWRMDLGCLRYLAHWVTPPVESRRFSARFFLASVPEGTAAAHDTHETTASAWIAPAAALRRYRVGEIDTAPPTLRILEQLAEQPSIAAALAMAPHAPVSPTSPQIAPNEATFTLVLDGDPLHPTAPGDRMRRFVLESGRWVTRFEER